MLSVPGLCGKVNALQTASSLDWVIVLHLEGVQRGRLNRTVSLTILGYYWVISCISGFQLQLWVDWSMGVKLNCFLNLVIGFSLFLGVDMLRFWNRRVNVFYGMKRWCFLLASLIWNWWWRMMRVMNRSSFNDGKFMLLYWYID